MSNICCFLKTSLSALVGPVYFFAAQYYSVYWTDRNEDCFSNRMHGAPLTQLALYKN